MCNKFFIIEILYQTHIKTMQKLLCERPLTFLKETQDLDVKKKTYSKNGLAIVSKQCQYKLE